MANWKILGSSAALLALLTTTSARADVTAEQVWQNWVDYYTSLGAGLTTGSKGMQGDTLVVTDATFGSTTPTGSFSAKMPEVRLKEMGDGRVEVTFPAEIPITINGKDQAGAATDIAMKVNQTGMSMIASGVPEDLNYDFTSQDMSITLDAVKANDAAVPATAKIVMSGNKGKYHVVKQAGSAITSEFTSDKVTFDVGGKDPASNGEFTMTGEMNRLGGTSDMTMPAGVDLANMAAALTAGTDLKGNFTFGDGNYKFDMKDAEQTATGTAALGSGGVTFDMSKDGLTYGGNGTNAKVSLTASTIPFPVDVMYGETAFNLTMPVSKGEAPQPFALLLKVVDLSVSDGIWSLVDPTKQLPHDPATVVMDVTGAAKMLVDIFDPAMAQSTTPPGEVESVNLNNLQVKAAGAELTGKGAVTLDNSASPPKPVGAVDLQLVGGNALIDKLVAMGLVPQDQAGMAKMMMGMFAVPAGEDTMTSKIEFKEDGGIYANGQRLQ